MSTSFQIFTSFSKLSSCCLQSSDYDTSEHNLYDEDNEVCECQSRPLYGVLAYMQLIGIHSGKSKGRRLKDELRLDLEKVRRLSLSEQKFRKATTSYGTEVVRYSYINLKHVHIN